MPTDVISPPATPTLTPASLRKQLAQDPRTVTRPDVKQFLANRWQQLFLQEAAQDKRAVKEARNPISKVGVRDRRPPEQKIAERFLRGDGISAWQQECAPHTKPQVKNTTLVFCAGLLNGLLPDHAFRDEFIGLHEQHGWPIMRADMHPMRGCAPNCEDIRRVLDEGHGTKLDGSRQADQFDAPGDVVLMGYSKGGADILEFLARYPEYKKRVRAVVLWAGAVGGSYTADGIYDSIKDVDLAGAYQRLSDFLKVFSPFVQNKPQGMFRRLDEYNIKEALRDLTTHQRGAFLKDHGKALDALNIPIFTFTAATSFLRVPTFQMHDALSISKYDANNDMQLTQAQAKTGLPMETHLAILHGHHWDISYPPFPRAARLGSPNLDHPFPRKAAISALVTLLAEIGVMK
ncbi:MAG: alpha/beta hydrolase [Oleiphilaceae bacterium]|nr:alpha/beta hydrolase [Oleiphilaceae bacterium]